MQNYEYKSTLLKVSNLSLSYGTNTVLENISFEIKDIVRPGMIQGQCIAFLGRSGRGKSTLFRLIAGLEKPTSGEILIAQADHSSSNEKLKEIKEGDVGFVDQKYTLFRNKTLLESLNFSIRNSILGEKEKQDRISKLLIEWGLEKAKHNYPNELSGGQRQRTAILEQILNSNSFILMDEPFSGLDVGNIENVKDAMKLINNSNELNTLIFSTHDVELAVELADFIFIIGIEKENGAGKIITTFDLKGLGLSWHNEFTEAHFKLSKEIKKILLSS